MSLEKVTKYQWLKAHCSLVSVRNEFLTTIYQVIHKNDFRLNGLKTQTFLVSQITK